MSPATKPHSTMGFLPENLAGAIAYLTFIPAVVFLLVEPYKRDRFVRFHSIQCLLAWIAGLVVWAVLRLTSLVLFFIPVAGPLLVVLIYAVVILAAVVVWLVLLVKAVQGEIFKLPVLGDIAGRLAAAA